MDIFKKVDDGKHISPLQQKSNGVIQKKKKGRSRKPNMVKKLIKIDKVLYEQIKKNVDQEAGSTIAAFLDRAARRELNSPKAEGY